MNQKEILMITITIFITVIMWIFADLYHTANSQKVMEANPRFSRPISVQIPVDIFNTLEQRQ